MPVTCLWLKSARAGEGGPNFGRWKNVRRRALQAKLRARALRL